VLENSAFENDPIFEALQGRYMAVLIQTEVNVVAESIPGPRDSLGSARN
jgi:hypothetical protein